MNFLKLTGGFVDPSLSPVEIVERKGVGHPDSLADALANEVSVAFSRHCLERFGVVLHHNVDKLYVGGGDTVPDYGTSVVRWPMSVVINGRMADMFGGEPIDIRSIQRDAALNYLQKVLPRLTSSDVRVDTNATQRHRVTYRYRPKDKTQIPHTIQLKANDTSCCVANWPPTVTESITYRLERYFWENVDGYAIPRFPEVGQDIKVFVLRTGTHLEVTVCMPTISSLTGSYATYRSIVAHHESALRELAHSIAAPAGLSVSLHVNEYQDPYMLCIGTCAECGEEGVVGRGNNILGIISSNRIHTQESWAGKNPVYHTGRVLGYLTLKLARAVSTKLGVKCSIMAMTQCGGSLIPPASLVVTTDRSVDRHKVEEIVDADLISARYLDEILAFRPWMVEL